MSGVTVNVFDPNTGLFDNGAWTALSEFFDEKNKEILDKLTSGTPLQIFYKVLDYRYIVASLDVINKYTQQQQGRLKLSERNKVNARVNALLDKVGVKLTKKGDVYQVVEIEAAEPDQKRTGEPHSSVSSGAMTVADKNAAIQKYAGNLAGELQQEVRNLSAMLDLSVSRAISSKKTALTVDPKTGLVTELLDAEGNVVTTSRLDRNPEELKSAAEHANNMLRSLHEAFESDTVVRRKVSIATGGNLPEPADTPPAPTKPVAYDLAASAEPFMGLVRSLTTGDANVGDPDTFKSIFNTSGSKLSSMLGLARAVVTAKSVGSAFYQTARKSFVKPKGPQTGETNATTGESIDPAPVTKRPPPPPPRKKS